MSSIKGPAQAPTEFLHKNRIKVGIVHARWNKEVIDALVKGTIQSLKTAGLSDKQIVIESVPGSWELPMGVQNMFNDPSIHVIVAIGCVIKGSTMHFEYICENSFSGLMRVALDTKKPVVLGVLTALTEDQALERAGIGRGEKKGHNHGLDWGMAAVEMADKSLNAKYA